MGVGANNTETTTSVIWNGANNEFSIWQKWKPGILHLGSEGTYKTKAEGYNLHLTMDRVDFLNLKTFCASKGDIQREKTQPTEWKTIFAHNISDKSLFFRIHQECLQISIKITQILKRKRTWIDPSPDNKYSQQTHENLANISSRDGNAN